MKMRFLLLAPLFAVLAACGGSPQDPVLGRAGTEEVRASQLQQFMERMPEGLRQGDSPFEVRRRLLESLIDMRLLAQEAKQTRIEEDPAFVDQLETARRGGLMDLYQRRQINDHLSVSSEELERRYRETHRDRALRFSGIMLPTKEDAERIVALLKKGADFHQLAATHSEHKETGERGGDSGGYKLRDQMTPAVAEGVAHLKVGEISAPVPVQYNRRTHFAVFKILDEMPAPLAASEALLREELMRAKRMERIRLVLDSLTQAYAPQTQEAQLTLFSQRCQQSGEVLPQFSAPEAALPLVTFQGGQITVGDLLSTAQEAHFSPRQLATVAAVDQFLKTVTIPAHLFETEAMRLQLDRDSTLVAGLARKREELSLKVLRQREVDSHVSASEEEARAFYDANPEKFTAPETILVTEILVASDSLAQQLKRRLEEGEDATALALKHTQREGAIHHQGQIRLNVFTEVFFQGINAAAQRLEPGEVGGPVRVREGYSVFKVTDKVREKAPYDAESRRRALAYVKVDKAKRAYVEYVRSLRDKYRVEVDEAALRQLPVAEPAAAAKS
ncbi:MAG: peptidyl-prolyl cis-trans isomerase [Candidatus Handelsmanbacteria bacterium]|nr:peptidyl-prolyl cis-trans isomerase [Candidatus Handelsmanbacteria bacterium]